MSAQYWQMKLDSTYVKHNDSFKKIVEVARNPDHNAVRESYPEKMVKSLIFRVVPDGWVQYKDFNIVWPKEQYKRIDSKAVFATRTMQKSYKLAPNTEAFRVQDGVAFKRWLNAPQPRLNAVEEIFEADGDLILADDIAYKKEAGYDMGLIHLAGYPVLQATIRKGNVTFEKVVGNLPGVVVDMFDPYLDVVNKWKGPEIDPKMKMRPAGPDGMLWADGDPVNPGRVTIPGLNFSWRVYPYNMPLHKANGADVLMNWSVCVHEHHDRPAMYVKYRGSLLIFHKMRDVDEVVDLMSRTAREDVKRIMATENFPQ